MKNKVRYTAQALHDLDEVWDYISFELQNPQAAEKTVNRILDKVDQLVEFAQSGALLSAVSEVMGEERFLVCDSYMFFTIAKSRRLRSTVFSMAAGITCGCCLTKQNCRSRKDHKQQAAALSNRKVPPLFCLFREIQGTLRSQR